MRIDKWLWAARFFKTRSLASKACEFGNIEVNGMNSKPSREIKNGDMLRVKNPSGEFTIEVLQLSDMRGPAPVAQTLYRETDESRAARIKMAEMRKAMPQADIWTDGRPSKRDRREINRVRGRR